MPEPAPERAADGDKDRDALRVLIATGLPPRDPQFPEDGHLKKVQKRGEAAGGNLLCFQGCWPRSHRGENSASDPAASPCPAEGKGIQQGCRGGWERGVPAPTAISTQDQRQESPLQHQTQENTNSPSSPQPPPLTENQP